MKTIKKIIKLNLVIMVIFFFACKKKDTPVTPITPVGTVAFHLHTNVDTTEIDSGDVGKDALGRKIQLNVAQFFISNIKLKKSDGTTVSFSGKHLLKDIEEEEYSIGSTSTGNYTSVTFDIGVDASANMTTPSSNSDVLNNSSMWFGSTSQGYIFMNIQGAGDTTGTGNNFRPFNYQLGTAAMYKTITLDYNAMGMQMSPLSVTTSGTAFIHIICDYGKLLQNVTSFKTNNTIATPFNSDSTVVKQIANNIPNMFRFEM